MAKQKINRHDFLKTFAQNYNDQSPALEVTPIFISQQIEDRTLMSNMFSSYVVRPKAFDPEPLGLPKKYQHLAGGGPQQQIQHPQSVRKVSGSNQDSGKQQPRKTSNNFDDFETVSAPKKKPKAPKVVQPAASTPTDVKPLESVENVAKEQLNQQSQPEKATVTPQPVVAQKVPQQAVQVVEETKEQPQAVSSKQADLVASLEQAQSSDQQMQPTMVVKGPRPKGMKKFKPVVEEAEVPYEELSENQKRKADQKRKKAEEQAQSEAEKQARLEKEAAEQAVLAKLQAERDLLEKQKKFEEEQRRRTEEVFANLSKQNQEKSKTTKKPQQQSKK